MMSAAEILLLQRESETKAFIDWLQQRPGARINSKIKVADMWHRGAGRGIVAIGHILPKEELFSISLQDVLAVQTSSLAKQCPELLKGLDPWDALVLTMIYEDGQREKSIWWPYFNILPHQFDTLIYWSNAELDELEGSAVVSKIGKESAERSFTRVLLPIVTNHAHLFGIHQEAFQSTGAANALIELAHRMATLIMAYGFTLDHGSNPDMEDSDDDFSDSESMHLSANAMVPLADLFNADGDRNNAHIVQDQGSLTMVAMKDILVDEEIFNDYGALPSSDLLRRYGYLTEQYKQWDVVELSVRSITDACQESQNLSEQEKMTRVELADHWEVLQDGYDLTREIKARDFDSFGNDLLLLIAAFLMPGNAVSAALKIADSPEHPPYSLHLPICHILKSILQRRSKEYRTTIAEDVNLLREGSELSKRHQMAVQVRLGEKEILALAWTQIDEKIEALQGELGNYNDDDDDDFFRFYKKGRIN